MRGVQEKEMKMEIKLKIKDILHRQTDMGKRKLDLDIQFQYFTRSTCYVKQGHR